MIIEVKNLIKTYEGKEPVTVLKGVNLEIKEGEFIAIMGRSGCGKSTLLHQLGLLDKPTSGELFIEDENVLVLNEKERTDFRLKNLGYVFQEYALLPELTILESVAMPLMMAGVKERAYTKKAHEMLERVGLSHRLDHLPNEMSGGEQQRAAIARALINNPSVILADEPCANLDSEASKIVLDLFRKLNKDLGQTVVMVTHEAEDEKYVDRVIRMRDGIVI